MRTAVRWFYVLCANNLKLLTILSILFIFEALNIHRSQQLNRSSMFSPSHFAIGANPPLVKMQANVHLDGIFSPGSCRKLQPSTIQSTATLSIGGATRSGGSQSTTQSLWAWTAQSDAPNANCIAIFFYHTQDSVDSTPQWTNNRRRWRERRSDWRAEVEVEMLQQHHLRRKCWAGTRSKLTITMQQSAVTVKLKLAEDFISLCKEYE